MRTRPTPGLGRSFWLIWSGDTISIFGTYVTGLAVSVLVVSVLNGTATQVGVVNAAGWLPYLLFGLLTGVVVDRTRRWPLLVTADLGRAVVLFTVPLLAGHGALSPGSLVPVVFVVGAFSLLGDAAFQAYLPRLVDRAQLTAAHARLESSGAVARVSGPAVAGALIDVVGAPRAVVVDAVTYVISAALVVLARVPEPTPPRTGDRHVMREITEGLRWVYRHPTLRPLALGSHAWFACVAITGAVVTPFALRTVGLGPFGLGLALAAAGIGGLLGSIVAVGLGRRLGTGRVIVAAQFVTGIAWGLVALSTPGWPGWLLFGLGQLVFGFSVVCWGPNEMGYRQAVTPDRLQGSDERDDALHEPGRDRRGGPGRRTARRPPRLPDRPAGRGGRLRRRRPRTRGDQAHRRPDRWLSWHHHSRVNATVR